MTQKNHYLVAADDLTESERFVFKIIFSVSGRSPSRSVSYGLFEGDTVGRPDLLIVPAGSDNDRSAHAGVPVVTVGDQSRDDDAGRLLQRPLIATRVLAALDAIVEQDTRDISTDTPTISVSHSAAEVPTGDTNTPTSLKAMAPTDRWEGRGSAVAAAALSGSESVARAAQASRSGGDCSDIKGARALVVDDSGAVRKQLELELARFDVRVDYAVDAAGAFALLDANRYDVAFLDVVLPDQDGFQICRSVKTQSQDTTVIMLTSKATQADKLRGSMAGCDSYLTKPVGRTTFQNTVRNHLPLLETARAMGA